MKLISLDGRKKVMYFGIELVVRDWVSFLATDESGLLVGYYAKPENNRHPCSWMAYGMTETIGLVDLEGLDWKDSLKVIVQE